MVEENSKFGSHLWKNFPKFSHPNTQINILPKFFPAKILLWLLIIIISCPIRFNWPNTEGLHVMSFLGKKTMGCFYANKFWCENKVLCKHFSIINYVINCILESHLRRDLSLKNTHVVKILYNTNFVGMKFWWFTWDRNNLADSNTTSANTCVTLHSLYLVMLLINWTRVFWQIKIVSPNLPKFSPTTILYHMVHI